VEGFIINELVWQLKYDVVEVVHHTVAMELDI
jgi:hypothetical protein